MYCFLSFIINEYYYLLPSFYGRGKGVGLLLSFYRNSERECCSFILLCVDVDTAMMLVYNDIVGDDHAETRALAYRFGSEGFVEQSATNIIGHTATVVTYTDDEVTVIHLCLYADSWFVVLTFVGCFLGHGITCIIDYVEDGTAEVLWNYHDAWHTLLIVLADGYVERFVVCPLGMVCKPHVFVQ